MKKSIFAATAGAILFLSLAGCATNEGSRIGKGEWRRIEGDVLGRWEFVWPDEEGSQGQND